MSYEEAFNNITGLFDPFHIIIKKMDPNVSKYKELVKKYNDIYYDIVKRKSEEWARARGVKPMVLVETAGNSISLPNLIEGEQLAGADLTRGAVDRGKN